MKRGRGLLVLSDLTVALKRHAPRGLHIKQAKYSVFFINSFPLCVSWVAAVMAASNTNLPTETKEVCCPFCWCLCSLPLPTSN